MEYNLINIKETFKQIYKDYKKTKDRTLLEAFGKYVDLVKTDPVLKTQYNVITNLEKYSSDSDITDFINENIRLIRKYNLETIRKSNKKVTKLLNEINYKPVNSEKQEHKLISDILYSGDDLVKLYESKSKYTNLLIDRNSSKSSIKQPDSIKGKLSENLNTLVEEYNTKYTTDNEELNNIISLVINKDVDGLNETFDKVKKDCYEKVTTLINENSDVEFSNKLLKTKIKIMETELGDDYSGIIKLIDLREVL